MLVGKIEREFRSRDIQFHSIVFVRDDVYTLLMHGSADYGKEMRASLDWSEIPDQSLVQLTNVVFMQNLCDLVRCDVDLRLLSVFGNYYEGQTYGRTRE
jgi:hypothetical protein